LLGSVSPGLVSGGPPLLRFSSPARLFRRGSLCVLVMASVKGLVPCRAAGGGSLRPDLEFSFCVEGLGGWPVWVVLGVVVRVSSPSSSSGRYPLVFRLAATSFCR
jgi:hypothetical protein